MKAQLSNLVRDPNLERLTLSLKVPNFFEILKISKTEIRHSNFLAWLLTPNESHNLTTVFLRWFLKELFSSDKIEWANEFTIDSYELNHIKILREWKNIDIVIVHKDFVIAIENKIKSNEHSDQLNKYNKLIKEAFPNVNHAFVFLTVDGTEPENEEDSKEYTSIDYNLIKSNIEIILDVYSNSISPKIKHYIDDYLLILKREIMHEHESIDLARELYKNHKKAIDFIIEHKPDRISKIKEIIEDAIVSEGYKLETCNKYYARFLTQRMSSLLPNSGINGWKNNESFLFEVAYWEKGISFKCVISPGNQNNINLLSDIMRKLPNSKIPSGQKWLTFYSNPKKVDFLNADYEKDEAVEKVILDLLKENKIIIEQIENEIVKISEKFER